MIAEDSDDGLYGHQIFQRMISRIGQFSMMNRMKGRALKEAVQTVASLAGFEPATHCLEGGSCF